MILIQQNKSFVITKVIGNMNSSQLQPSWFSMVPPNPPMSSSFWAAENVRARLKDLQETLALAKAIKKELEILITIKDGKGSLEQEVEKEGNGSPKDGFIGEFIELLDDRGISMESQVSISVEAANSLMSRLRFLIEPIRVVTDEMCPWEEKSAVIRLSNKIRKSKRNKMWRKKKRKRIAESLVKERARFEQADQEADEWRAREIAKDIAKRKVEKMKEIAKLKAKEERKKIESELELVLIVEKLQELRAIRIEKLKKLGHFLPDEDDKFLERVQAAAEEEERQAIASADTEAAKDAIATAEESRNMTRADAKDLSSTKQCEAEESIDPGCSSSDIPADQKERGNQIPETTRQGYNTGAYESIGNLPIEMYHYYHGSNKDIGTLVEVRRMWDNYIRPGGSRIPGHWVRPSPPSSETWASYLASSK